LAYIYIVTETDEWDHKVWKKNKTAAVLALNQAWGRGLLLLKPSWKTIYFSEQRSRQGNAVSKREKEY
jgi:hypothetical protein